jgi:hypothetical protein
LGASADGAAWRRMFCHDAAGCLLTALVDPLCLCVSAACSTAEEEAVAQVPVAVRVRRAWHRWPATLSAVALVVVHAARIVLCRHYRGGGAVLGCVSRCRWC